MSARDELHAYADRYGYTEFVTALLDAYRAEVLREAADCYARLTDQNEAYELAEHGAIDHESRLQYEAVRDVAFGLRRMADEAGQEKATPTGESTPADVTVYRAAYEHEPFPLGLYATRTAAEAHCEADVSREHPAGTALFFEWCVDEDDSSVAELDVRIGDEHTSTGYTVTTVVADATYDPEADS